MVLSGDNFIQFVLRQFLDGGAQTGTASRKCSSESASRPPGSFRGPAANPARRSLPLARRTRDAGRSNSTTRCDSPAPKLNARPRQDAETLARRKGHQATIRARGRARRRRQTHDPFDQRCGNNFGHLCLPESVRQLWPDAQGSDRPAASRSFDVRRSKSFVGIGSMVTGPSFTSSTDMRV